jgi:hypothetical protein
VSSVFNLKIVRGTGDGMTINSLVARGGLKALNLKGATLAGDGLCVGGPLGSLTVGDVQDGAAIVSGGTNKQAASTITAHVIGDDRIISFGTPVRTFTAASVGRSEIRAPSVSTLIIRGDKKLAIRGEWHTATLWRGRCPGKSGSWQGGSRKFNQQRAHRCGWQYRTRVRRSDNQFRSPGRLCSSRFH